MSFISLGDLNATLLGYYLKTFAGVFPVCECCYKLRFFEFFGKTLKLRFLSLTCFFIQDRFFRKL